MYSHCFSIWRDMMKKNLVALFVFLFSTQAFALSQADLHACIAQDPETHAWIGLYQIELTQGNFTEAQAVVMVGEILAEDIRDCAQATAVIQATLEAQIPR